MSGEMNEVVRVRRKKVAQCLTCHICNDLISDATTISECLHTFCRKCIYVKITDEELDCCPVCRTHLGCNPLDKLRADHSLQALRTKIFGPETEKPPKPADSGPSVPSLAKPTKQPVSSSKASDPKPPPEPSKAARKKRNRRKKSLAPLQQPGLPINNGSENVENGQNNLTSPNTKGKQIFTGQPSEQQVPDNSEDENAEKSEDKADQLTDLNLLADAVSKIAVENSAVNEVNAESALLGRGKAVQEESGQKVERRARTSRVQYGNKKGKNVSQPSPVKPGKIQGQEEKRAVVLGVPAQNVGTSNLQVQRSPNPFWFSLIASDNQEGPEPLPKLSAPYLKLKDGTATVSVVKKYLVKKFNLSSEAEVELTMRGHELVSTLTVRDLMELWFRTMPVTVKTQATPGSSAEKFVMALHYARKIANP